MLAHVLLNYDVEMANVSVGISSIPDPTSAVMFRKRMPARGLWMPLYRRTLSQLLVGLCRSDMYVCILVSFRARSQYLNRCAAQEESASWKLESATRIEPYCAPTVTARSCQIIQFPESKFRRSNCHRDEKGRSNHRCSANRSQLCFPLSHAL